MRIVKDKAVTVEDAIEYHLKREEESKIEAETLREYGERFPINNLGENIQVKYYRDIAAAHHQIADWLKDYRQLITQSTGAWIPINERLPEVGMQVLCCNECGSVFTSAITAIHENGRPKFGKHYGVVAWQPLPEPYENGGAE